RGPLTPGLSGSEPASLAYDHAQRGLWLLANGSGGKLFKVDDITGQLTATSFTSGQLTDPMTLAFDAPSSCRYTRTLSLSYSASPLDHRAWAESGCRHERPSASAGVSPKVRRDAEVVEDHRPHQPDVDLLARLIRRDPLSFGDQGPGGHVVGGVGTAEPALATD